MPVNTPNYRTSIAPMLDLTDRHFRYMARQISRHTRLYSEMIHCNALIHGNRHAFLQHHCEENPLVLQLGGSRPQDLAHAAKIGADFAYDEINLNCGCPSPRVQKGAFGACLMKESNLLVDCLNAMQEAVDIPVSVKHRIGIDHIEEYDFVRDFVGTLSEKTACTIFIVHARNAWLKGLSPKENRQIPPLKYADVYRLKEDFPHLTIVINGGIDNNEAIHQHLSHVDGVMLGREAYYHPWTMREWDKLFYGEQRTPINLDTLIDRLYHYIQQRLEENKQTTLRHIVRHYLGLYHGQAGAKTWRTFLSDPHRLAENRPELILNAHHVAQMAAEQSN